MPFRTTDDLNMTSQEDAFQLFPTTPTDLTSALDEIRILEAIIKSKDNEIIFNKECYRITNSEQSEKLKGKERLLVAKDKIIETKEKKLVRLEQDIVRLMEGDEGMELVEEELSGEKIQEQVKRKAARKALKKERTERKQTAKKLQIAGEKRAREDAMSDDEL